MTRFHGTMALRTKPYVPGKQSAAPGTLKLNTNENPYPPSPLVTQALRQLAPETLRLYPDPVSTDLRQAIANFHQLTPDQVFVGNGSDEVLAFAFMALFSPGKTIRIPAVTYSFYPSYAALLDLRIQQVPLREGFTIDERDYRGTEGGVVFPNPNAPTGRVLPLTAVRSICAANSECPVIVDEAYIDFGGESADSILQEFEQLLVVRTMSKSRSLAGLRIGYALGSPGIIRAITAIKDSVNSYPLDRIAQAAGEAAIRDDEYFRSITASIIQTREQGRAVLLTLGFRVLPSAANFLFVSHPDIGAAELAACLETEQILVRHFSQPEIADWLRISIGLPAEMERLIGVLDRLLSRRSMH